eukprot:TRINITY_DN8872_c0_g1_i1.p3 TRINITY_DN8872_c0_g1~~TRINITY_DN8872_c0_g1_i1.p3  ORF type:complete len:101 (-),score=27.59 TRINITY_DN8872_c0_g1_i1:13-315(-)
MATTQIYTILFVGSVRCVQETDIFLMDIEAPRVAKAAKPGQFIIIKNDEKGERIPLTIADYDKEKGTVTIVFQTVGNSTCLLYTSPSPRDRQKSRMPSSA